MTDTMTIKAYAYKAGMTDSSVTNTAGVPYIINPVITSITPSKGKNNCPVSVTISGQRFKAGATARLRHTGDPDVGPVACTVVDSTTITCIFDITGAPKAKWDVAVTNPDTGTYALMQGFHVQ